MCTKWMDNTVVYMKNRHVMATLIGVHGISNHFESKFLDCYISSIYGTARAYGMA